jgi:hypothetical protein
MKVGTRVLITAGWSSFHHRRGVITQIEPFIMVLLEGERKPLRMGHREFIADPEPSLLIQALHKATGWFRKRLV